MESPQELAVSFDLLREKNVEQLKTLNRVVFPIQYQDQIYKDCMACESITKLAFYNDVLVGAIAARCEKQPDGKAKMYIAMLGVLAPYRGYKIGRKMLSSSLASSLGRVKVVEVVWIM
eukprot:gene31189-6334_t